jgi:hypothetical protein
MVIENGVRAASIEWQYSASMMKRAILDLGLKIQRMGQLEDFKVTSAMWASRANFLRNINEQKSQGSRFFT